MRPFHNLFKRLGFCTFLAIVMSSCVNHLVEESDVNSNNGNIPLRIIPGIQELSQTRIIGSEFEEKDEVGLFALAGNTTMKEERYLDNMHFIYTQDAEFVPDDCVYFPDDEVTLNLISYFPYHKEGIAMGKSTMSVAVNTEQNMPGKYSDSDFLIASKQDVVATNKAIPLTYKHRFFKLKITLKSDENIEELLEANPQVSVCDFCTKAMYDFQNNSISGCSEVKNIIPSGDWKIEKDKLIGKELIIIPQEINPNYQYVIIQVGENTYESLLPSSLQLISGKQRELEISFKFDQDFLLSRIEGDIADWEETEIDHTESECINKYINISKLSFEQSNVYKVIHNGEQVAEICKEYLVADDVASQAIVAYPMKTDTHTADLSKGLVVQLLGNTGNVHGGSASWVLEENSLNYVAGNMPVSNYIYVKTDGQISLTKMSSDMLKSILAVSDVAYDVRGGTAHRYPIVKIGTQYWMRENLETSLYNDGNNIARLDTVTVGAAGYLLTNVDTYFYTVNAVLTHKLPMDGWDIPRWEDWNMLKKYLKGDAALLKSGIWKPVKNGFVAESNNKTGFNAMPLGFCLNSHISDFEGIYQLYWTVDDSGMNVEKGFLLRNDDNVMGEGAQGVNKAIAIRCIRK